MYILIIYYYILKNALINMCIYVLNEIKAYTNKLFLLKLSSL